MQKILFIDRDGTLIYEPADFQIDSYEKLEFLPGVLPYLSRIVAESESATKGEAGLHHPKWAKACDNSHAIK